MFFVTLAASLVSNKDGISGSSSGVPTPHSTELPVHFARVNNDHCHASESQSDDYRKQRPLFEVLTHYLFLVFRTGLWSGCAFDAICLLSLSLLVVFFLELLEDHVLALGVFLPTCTLVGSR